MIRVLLVLISLHVVAIAVGQQQAFVSGIITDEQDGQPVELATVVAQSLSTDVNTDARGAYRLAIPSGRPVTLLIRRTGYEHQDVVVPAQSPGAEYVLNISLKPVKSDLEVVVTGRKIDNAGVIRENVDKLKLIPSTTGNLESVLPYIALGTTSGTGGELTSQYNVRGGNYDENLVYVNDFEIYRPLLVRSGNQEGLTLPNPDLIRDLSFSSGGFEAQYGDKMSSVLDVRYKLPDSIRGSLMVSLLGASAHLEGSMPIGKDPYRKWRYLLGYRYKTSQYLLGSLDIKGEYTPTFTDYQFYTTFDLSRNWQVGLLANLNKNVYDFIPVSSQTATGLITYALRLSTDFEGAENDLFLNGMTGLSFSFVPDREKNPLFLKFLVSGYKSQEQENVDIIGQYRLSQIETDINNPNAGEEIALLGIGTQHVYTRNILQSGIVNAEVKGGIELQKNAENSNFIQAGLKWTVQDFTDHIHEWERLDSAGFSLPYEQEGLNLLYVLNSDRDVRSTIFSGYVQNTYTRQYGRGKELRITGGLRGQYSDVNDEFFLSPRAQLAYTPKANKGYRFAAGWYYQPPFYKELRKPDGVINNDVLSQKSFQLLAGYTSAFGPDASLGPKYKLIIEAYYKSLWDLVSYEVNNVQIRYAGENNATGYLTGLDFRINGELVPGAESWVNISFLHAREKLDGIQHLKREVGQEEGVPVDNVPRPTDQFMTLNMFFQDYLPDNENFRVHLNLSFGTGLPFGIKDNNIVYRNPYRYKAYHRVDIGFSFRLWSNLWKAAHPKNVFRFTRDSWMSLEILNLLQVRNEASKTWIKTIFEQQYAIPNYLSSRRVNLKFRFEF